MVSKVLLVGGSENLITSIRRNYASIGVEVPWWWHSDRTGRSSGASVPPAADAVVILMDVVDHASVASVWEMTRKLGKVVVRTSRRWVIARQALLDAGLGEEGYVPEMEPVLPVVRKPVLAEANDSGSSVQPEDQLTTIIPAPKPTLKLRPGEYDPHGKPRDELLYLLKVVVAELITGHDMANIRITDEGKITMEVRQALDLDALLSNGGENK